MKYLCLLSVLIFSFSPASSNASVIRHYGTDTVHFTLPNSVNNEPAYKALKNKNLTDLKTLIDQNAIPYYVTDTICPLSVACLLQNTKAAQLLLVNKHETDVIDAEGHTSMHYAFANIKENYALSSLLLKNGMNPFQKSNNNETPIEYAFRNNHYKTVKLCLQHANKTETPNQSWIYCTKYKVSPSMIQCLLSSGANINHVTPNGMTPLMLATFHLNFISADYLLRSGADVNFKTNKAITLRISYNDEFTSYPTTWYRPKNYSDISIPAGSTALDIAKRTKCSQSIIRLLLKHGAT